MSYPYNPAPGVNPAHAAAYPPAYGGAPGYNAAAPGYGQPYPGASAPYAAPGASYAPYAPPVDTAASTVVVVSDERSAYNKGGYAPSASDSYSGFMHKAIRMAFVRKVYSILALQLLVTFGIVLAFCVSAPLKAWVQNNPGFLWAAFGVQFGTLIALSCCGDARRRYPTNVILLGVFTLAESYMLGAISSYYSTNSVVMALGITVGVCLGLTLFAWQTKYDFTTCGGTLAGILLVFVICGFLFIPFHSSRSDVLSVVWAGIGACIFCVFLVYDTQQIIGGKHRVSIGIDEYVMAALQLYLDVVQLFLYILQMLGKRD